MNCNGMKLTYMTQLDFVASDFIFLKISLKDTTVCYCLCLRVANCFGLFEFCNDVHVTT